MRITKLFKEIFDSEKAGGLILIGCTILSLIIANSSLGEVYQHFWHISIAGHGIVHRINDGLMTIFFLLIGLGLEREIDKKELSKIKEAMLPVFCALRRLFIPRTFIFSF